MPRELTEIEKQNLPEPKMAQVVFQLGSKIFLPHYRNSNIFVGPGYPRHNKARFTSKELIKLGAKPASMMLWIRESGGEVTDNRL